MQSREIVVRPLKRVQISLEKKGRLINTSRRKKLAVSVSIYWFLTTTTTTNNKNNNIRLMGSTKYFLSLNIILVTCVIFTNKKIYRNIKCTQVYHRQYMTFCFLL